MNTIVINFILVIFPILIFLVFSCYDVFNDLKIKKVIFIITIFTSLYFCLNYNNILLLCNIPILICYLKKEWMLGLIISMIVIIDNYLQFNIYILIFQYIIYFIVYIFLYNNRKFNVLYFNLMFLIQGLFLLFEYYDNFNIIFYNILVFLMSFIGVYLFKLADDMVYLHASYKKVLEDNKFKNSLFKLTHEIKNPIAVCKGYLGMIDINDCHKSKKYIDIIKTEIDRSLNIMNDFMEYSKIKINKEMMDINILLEEVYDSFNLLFKNRIKFIFNNRYDEIIIYGDYERLKQVLINIIKNSIESITSSGIIIIDVLVDKNINISIKDTGLGMDKETLDNVMEMFYTTKKNGTGIGVSLSKEIILAHNGNMYYESVLNEGTTCVITLPR